MHNMLMKAELSVEGKKRKKTYVKLGDAVEEQQSMMIQETSQEIVELPILVGGRCE